MNFRSDNEAPVHPKILEAIAGANEGFAPAYAEDEWSRALNRRFSETFECDCQVLPLATGTAGNAIALSELSPPWGAVFCHRQAHINVDECGAPEFYGHGLKLIALEGEHGRLEPETLATAIDGCNPHDVHNAKPAAVSITQATECGTTYHPEQIAAIAEICRERDLPLHMDGARFANAVARLKASPAELTWRAGVDALTFGAGKNGCMVAEAIVLFDHPEWVPGMERRRKRGGHLLSKMRYVSAQLLAYLEDDLWLELASHANLMASKLAETLSEIPGAKLEHRVEANEIFVHLPTETIARLRDAGAQFHNWPGSLTLLRLVCSFATTPEDIRAVSRILGEASNVA